MYVAENAKMRQVCVYDVLMHICSVSKVQRCSTPCPLCAFLWM